ncbi:MAG TPA: hypothetical protein VK826_19950 [Bacteroidia bacterium]|nr:hypothetical protein [Bacteroidia bacterium]
MKSKHIPTLVRYSIIGIPIMVVLWNCGGKTETDTPPVNTIPVSWNMPVEVSSNSQVDFAVFGWESFIALNWPADTSYRGKPDTSMKIGTGSPVVWETFRLKEETFYSDAAINPGPWNASAINGQPRRSFAHKSMFRVTKDFDSIPQDAQGGEFNEAAVNVPLIDQDSDYVMFEIAINESEYTYIVDHDYYNGNVQMREVHDSSFVNPPKGDTLVQQQGDSLYYQMAPSMAGLPAFAQYGATEVKTSWRVLPATMPADQVARYYHRTSVIAQPGGGYVTAVVGLVGLHILRLTAFTHNTWYWASFEQVDNVTVSDTAGFTPSFNPGGDTSYTNGYCYGSTCGSTKPATITDSLPANPTPVRVSRYGTIPAYIDSLNDVYQGYLAGTVWEFYQMVGVVNQETGSGSQYPMFPSSPTVYLNVGQMANTTMETYVQNGTNCVTCHAFGTPQFYKGNSADSLYALAEYQIFTFLLGDAATTGASEAIKRKKLQVPK